MVETQGVEFSSSGWDACRVGYISTKMKAAKEAKKKKPETHPFWGLCHSGHDA